MMDDIVVEFSGWVKISPQNIRFEYIGQDDMPQNIDGVQWQALSEDEQADYILEDAIAAIRDADDGEWVDLSVEVHQPI
jgi:hypothetical protein